MDNSLCTSLITWIRTFPGHNDITISSLTDGVVLATLLHKIAPEYFTQEWLSKIKTDVSNWRLKVSNLRKVVQGMIDYYYELPGEQLQLPSPDVNKIVETEDEIEMGRLLQLALGCAINCEQKQKHIEGIMQMEERVQALIMSAIQDLIIREGSPGPAEGLAGPASFHPHVKTLVEQLETTSIAKEDMARRCNELDLQINVLTEDKRILKEDNGRLQERLEALESGVDPMSGGGRMKDLRKHVDSLRDELFKVETARDEYRSRVDSLEQENKDVITRNDDLQKLAQQATTLKDEVDALRDMSERVAVYETTIDSYKKKMEEFADLKRQLKITEEKNASYMQQNMELEEELNKSGTWRPQLDLYKKQVSELHQRLADEAKKTDRHLFDKKKLAEKLGALTQEKDRAIVERDSLKETVEELRCTVSALSSPDPSSRPPSDSDISDTLEIIPTEIREKLWRLQHENRLLRQRASSESGDGAKNPVMDSLLADLQERHDKLNSENRELNRRIMDLESEVVEARDVARPTEQTAQTNRLERAAAPDCSKELKDKTSKIARLEETLDKKESEMCAMEERYKKYLTKAKAVIRSLDPKQAAAATIGGATTDVATLRAQMLEKDKLITDLQKEAKKKEMIREVEDKLVSTAFHNYGMQMHRQSVNHRLSTLDNGQSFLARQRQTSAQRTMNNTMPAPSQYYDYS